jgi:hypothetical protein
MDPRLRAFFAPQLTSEGIFPFEKLPPKAGLNEKAGSSAKGSKPSQPAKCEVSKAPAKPETSNARHSAAESEDQDDLEVTVTVGSKIILNFIEPAKASLPPENSDPDDEQVTVTVGSKIIPNFISNAAEVPFFGVKDHFTHQLQLFSKKTLFTRPSNPEPLPKPKRERPDPFPKLLEFMKFESILSENLRKIVASKLDIESLIERSTVPNATLLRWLWPMKEHIVSQWDSMESLSRTQKLEALRMVKKAVQLKMKVEKADRVCQYLLADQKKKKLPRPPELALSEDEVPIESSVNPEAIAAQEDMDLKSATPDASKSADQQLFLHRFPDEKTPKKPFPPDDPGGGEVRGSADNPNANESHSAAVLANQPVRPPPPVHIFRDRHKRRRSKR